LEIIILPQIEYNNFAKTRDTIQIYAQLISAIKGKLVPHQKNWEEFSLKVYAKGFTTTSIPIQTDNGIEVYFLFLKLRGSSLKEKSNINFWPHHFDLALLVFSGKLIDGQDETNWDYSREQMNFGLSSGDAGIPQPYFYVTAYPFDKTLLKIELPEFAEWHTEGWNGLVVKLNQLANQEEIFTALFSLFTELLNKNFNLIVSTK
jgi:hypothetical protein